MGARLRLAALEVPVVRGGGLHISSWYECFIPQTGSLTSAVSEICFWLAKTNCTLKEPQIRRSVFGFLMTATSPVAAQRGDICIPVLLVSLRIVGGVAACMKVCFFSFWHLELINNHLSSSFCVRSLCAAVHTYYLACSHCPASCFDVLFSNKIVLLMDLLLHQLTVSQRAQKTIFSMVCFCQYCYFNFYRVQ